MKFDEGSSDEELMQAYQNGADGAFDLLFRRHSARVYGFLMNQLKNAGQADDVFQATFLKLHQSRRHYDPAFPFAPWLFTVCKSVLLDHRRKQKRIQEDANSSIIEQAMDERTSEQTVGLEISSVALEGLSSREQAAVKMRYEDDLPFEEIALRLKVSPSHARQIISRGIKSLRKILAPAEKGIKS